MKIGRGNRSAQIKPTTHDLMKEQTQASAVGSRRKISRTTEWPAFDCRKILIVYNFFLKLKKYFFHWSFQDGAIPHKILLRRKIERELSILRIYENGISLKRFYVQCRMKWKDHEFDHSKVTERLWVPLWGCCECGILVLYILRCNKCGA
jgi:hypothetical protein